MKPGNKRMRAGDRFGRLTLASEAGRAPDGSVVWLCNCDCGKAKTVLAFRLRSGNTSSCGCWQREAAQQRATKHGHSQSNHDRTPTYHSWAAMLMRCRDRNNKSYGARGISVCERWLVFENFLSDMGERPEGKTIDRYPDKNGNYEPGNCRWASEEEQQNNRRNNCILEHCGKRQSLASWCKELGLSRVTVEKRIKRGLPVHLVLSKADFREHA